MGVVLILGVLAGGAVGGGSWIAVGVVEADAKLFPLHAGGDDA